MSSSHVSTSSLCGLSLIQSHSFLYVSYLNRFALHKKHVEGILVTFEAKKKHQLVQYIQIIFIQGNRTIATSVTN